MCAQPHSLNRKETKITPNEDICQAQEGSSQLKMRVQRGVGWHVPKGGPDNLSRGVKTAGPWAGR